ncbi:glycosyltransferase [Candidatus Saccharibacteria bacterium]|nr:glycosyltransferase [Candidatus Saccharibacteria bacterium]
MVKELVEKHEDKFHRFFEMVPGLLTWGVLLSPVWLGRIAPQVVVFFLTFLAIFWVYRAFIHLVGVVVGYRRYNRESKVDWLSEIQNLWGFEHLKHLVIIPAVSESYEVLEGTFSSIADQDYPQDKIFVAFSVEEKNAKRILKDVKKIKKKFGKRLGTVWTFVHPRGLPGEAVGAASNRTWAAKRAVEKIKELGFETDDFLMTTLDADMRFHPQFLARLSRAFLTDPERKNKFFQTAVYLFDNNLWDVPPLMRIQANSITLAVLSSWVIEPDRKDTWSCYSVPLTTLMETGYWDTSLGVDDTPFYWRTLIKKEGNFEGHHFYVPVYADAVQDEGFIKTHVSQYKQLLRWGWGVITFPIAMKGFLTTKMSLSLKLSKLYHLLEQYTIWRTVTFLITFGFLLLTLANPDIRLTSAGYRLPKITGVILTTAFIFLVPLTFLRSKISSNIPSGWPWWKRVWAWVEGPLVILNLLTYTFIPYIDAETRLMLGKRLEFWPTPKVREQKEDGV